MESFGNEIFIDCGNVRTTVSNFSELLAFLAAGIRIINCCYIMED